MKETVWVSRVRHICAIILVLLLTVIVPMPALAQDAQDFTIRSFEADYYVARDAQHISTLTVHERVVAQFPDFDQNHGILRALPQTYQGHSVGLQVDRITDASGHQLKYTTSTSNDNTVLKIGDPDKYTHGIQEYDISYHLQNVTAKYSDHDEFFWDINGDQWQQPALSVTARVHVPAELASSLWTDQRCYTGTDGSRQMECIVDTKKAANETLVTFNASRTMNAGETLSVVLGFAPNTFAKYTVPLSQILWTIAGVVFFGLLPGVVALWIVLHKWRQYGRDAKGRGTIVPEYLPPKDVSVLGSSEILKQRFVPAAISAQILDLAVQHYIKIYEVKEEKKFRKDKVTYTLELIKTTRGLRPEEKSVVQMLFGDTAEVGVKVDLGDLTNKLYKKAVALGKTIDSQLSSEGYFLKPPQKIFQTYITWGIVLAVFGFVFPPFTLGLLLAGIIVLAAARLMPARTQKGVEVRDYLYGLRDYMKLAETDRIKALQSPRGELTEKIDTGNKTQLVKLYERLLPYAMLFGIEREWAQEFAHLYQDTQPDWYSGSSAFNALYFAGALHNFSAVSATSFTPPSSSSSSGFSGGGAGGGGGGGGGGGW